MKKSAISRLKKKLWKVFTTFIKARDGRRCFTCGRLIEPGKGLHCGHFIPSKVCGYELRYDEDIVHVQCYFCNINLGGFGAMYYVKMVEKYDQEFVNKIFKRFIKHKKKTEKWKENDYLDKIEYFENKVKNMKK